jgi:hypothetical protein
VYPSTGVERDRVQIYTYVPISRHFSNNTVLYTLLEGFEVNRKRIGGHDGRTDAVTESDLKSLLAHHILSNRLVNYLTNSEVSTCAAGVTTIASVGSG